jgi:acyl-coenzyme A synthetase/AMP-(fatty) acid ligase
VRDRLAHFKCPRDFHFVEELPKTATGKIQRFKLRRPTPPPEVEAEADPSPLRGG